MDTEERREALLSLLKGSDESLTGTELATYFNVSRQVIVQDIAILRASGVDVLATPQGYLLSSLTAVNEVKAVAACQHTFDQIEDEISIIVDHGGRVLDVMVEHPVYGELRGSLMITSRRELKMFINKLDQGKANPLLTLTGGVHLHTLSAPDQEVMNEIMKALDEAGLLVK